jgi:hypothetical protein
MKMSEDLEKIYDEFMEKGWGDGLPIIPPTEVRVKRMLEFTDRKPDDALGQIPPSDCEATVEAIAANAVAAGCKPEYFPVVLAGMEALLDGSNLRASFVPHRADPFFVVNGPIAKELDISSGWGMGPFPATEPPNKRANMTISRAIVRSMYNIGGDDKPPKGIGFRLGMCIAENEDMSPWEPLHVERGFARETSTVSAKNMVVYTRLRTTERPGRPSGIFSIDSRNWAKSLLPVREPHGVTPPTEISSTIITMHPLTAKWWADNGMGKDDIRRFLYETCRMSWKEWYSDYPPQAKEDILNTAFATSPRWMRDLDLVPLFPNFGKDIWIIVYGPEPISYGCGVSRGGYAPCPFVTKPITFTDGTPVKSVFDFKHHK